MGVAPPPTRREELAEFLRHRRESTAPDAVGLPANGVRRTPGLRREEVALLAGVGLSWYTWLEQGRDITPSASVLDALARVYGLSGPERAHLFNLADVPVPLAAAPYPYSAPPELAAVVEAFAPHPCMLIGPRTDVLAVNRASTMLLGEVGAGPDGVANLLWWHFTQPRFRGSSTARSTLARFRAEHARRYDDPAFAELITALQAESPAFRELWARHEVLDAQLGTKEVAHDEFGPLALLHLQTIPTSHPDLRLLHFLPADAASRAALANAT